MFDEHLFISDCERGYVSFYSFKKLLYPGVIVVEQLELLVNGLLLLGRHFAVFDGRCTEVFNSGDLVLSLVVADQTDFPTAGPHQG